MHDAGVVRGRESRTGLAQDPLHFLHRDRPVALHHGAQVLADDQRHDQVRESFGLADVVHRHDVRMAQVGDRLGLTAEAHHQIGREAEVGAQHLHGEVALEAKVAHAEHFREAAGTDPVLQFVARAERTTQLLAELRRTDARRADRHALAGLLHHPHRGLGAAHVAIRRHPRERGLAGRARAGGLAHGNSGEEETVHQDMGGLGSLKGRTRRPDRRSGRQLAGGGARP
ncbi:MAG: hypothetical protein V9E87_02995 [Gemmatimonadales bacterium]